jgi:PIN domain nuclease of toxin-antitoxin system
MRYLLDTHILLWVRLSPEKLSKNQKIIIESSEDEKFISSISIWEISLKFSLGKLNLGDHTPSEFIGGIEALGIKHITPSPDQYASYYLLPRLDKHKDPFDRMIIWHAMQSGLTLISNDKQLSQYKLHGLEVV